MENLFFIHEIRGNNNTIDNKGIVVAATYDAARQGYHSYLGAYAYGHDENTDFVQCMITDKTGEILMRETWNAPQPEPEA